MFFKHKKFIIKTEVQNEERIVMIEEKEQTP